MFHPDSSHRTLQHQLRASEQRRGRSPSISLSSPPIEKRTLAYGSDRPGALFPVEMKLHQEYGANRPDVAAPIPTAPTAEGKAARREEPSSLLAMLTPIRDRPLRHCGLRRFRPGGDDGHYSGRRMRTAWYPRRNRALFGDNARHDTKDPCRQVKWSCWKATQ